MEGVEKEPAEGDRARRKDGGDIERGGVDIGEISERFESETARSGECLSGWNLRKACNASIQNCISV